MKKFLLRGVLTLLLLLVAVFAYVQFTLVAAGGGLPVWDGELTVSGIDAEIRISRDEHGNPHIEASSDEDLYFAQGFVHAQDRFWQMALTRQATLGRLSEWLGSLALGNDRMQRMWDWQQLAETSYAAMTPDERRLLDAYTAGVNAWLESDLYRRPPEMRILHVHPEPWAPTDSFVVGSSMFLVLGAGGSERTDGQLQSAGVSRDVYDLLDGSIAKAPLIIGTEDNDTTLQLSMPVKDKAYSDNWTLAGEHTTTGLPLMANDPQLPISLPNTWQLQAHHLGDSLRAGGTFPGIPGIGVGHNGSVAWGITNAVVDAIDLAYLELHPDDHTRYRRGPDSDWESFIERNEPIKVRFASDHTEIVRRTSKGHVWPEGVRATVLGDRTGIALEIRSVIHEAPGKSISAFINLNRAGTVEEGINAMRDLSSLALNFSLADVDGSIGYVATGSIAVRDRAHATKIGFYPDDDNDWEILDFDQNPRIVNPDSGRIVSANQQIIGDEYPHYLTNVWETPYRAWRIHELLDETTRHDVASFHEMQSDTLSPVARRITPLLLEVEPADSADAVLVDILENWDFRFTLDSEAPVIWATWTAELRHRMLGDKIGSAQPPGYGGFFFPLSRALSGERSAWCDDTTSDEIEDCGMLLAASLTAARRSLDERFGTDPSAWRWGDVGRFRHTHLGFDGLPLLTSRFSRVTPLKGGPASLFTNALQLDEAPAFSRSFFSSSYQGIYDLASLEDSLFMISGGTSGHFKSPHYDDMTARWMADERIKLGRTPDTPSHVLSIRPSTP